MTAPSPPMGRSPRTLRRAKGETEANPWLSRPVLVIFCAVSAVLPSAREVFGADSPILIVALDALLLVLLLLGFMRRPPYAPLWVVGGLLTVVGAVMSGTNSSVRGSLFVGATLAVLCVLFPFALARLCHDRPRAAAQVAGWFLVGQTVSAAAGIAQLAGIHIATGLIFGRATGFAGHPNTLGVMAALALIAVLGLWRSAGAAIRVALAGAFLLNSAALAATGSLSAMLAAIAAIAVGVVAARRVIGTVVSAIIVGAGGFAAWQILLPGQDSLLSSIGYRLAVVTGDSDGAGGAASLDVRGLTYEWAWRSITASPIIGVGMDPSNAGTFDGQTVVHNFLLRGWYQGGLPVFVWLVLLTGAVIVTVLRALRTRRGGWAAAGAVCMIVFAFTSAFLNQPAYWWPLQFALIVAVLMQRENVDSASPRDRQSRLVSSTS